MTRQWSKRGWRRYAAFAALVGGPFGSYDLVTHRWTDAAITLGSTALTLVWTRRGFRMAAQQEAHKPDYAKIARLEVELGLVDPPRPPETEPVVKVSYVQGGPFIRHAPEGRRASYLDRPSPQTQELTGPLAREPSEIYPNAAPGTMNDYLNREGRQVKWQRCPVCTRVHEGRCPG